MTNLKTSANIFLTTNILKNVHLPQSSSSLKDEYVLDAAIRYYVLIGAGIKATQVCLTHLNKHYVYQGGEYDLTKLFATDDITSEVEASQPEIENSLKSMRLCLAESDIPLIKAGKQCTKPYRCSFYGYCHQDELANHISQLPRISEKLLQRLEEIGVNDILEIPADFPGLNEIQQRVRDCVVNGTLYLDRSIQPRITTDNLATVIPTAGNKKSFTDSHRQTDLSKECFVNLFSCCR